MASTGRGRGRGRTLSKLVEIEESSVPPSAGAAVPVPPEVPSREVSTLSLEELGQRYKEGGGVADDTSEKDSPPQTQPSRREFNGRGRGRGRGGPSKKVEAQTLPAVEEGGLQHVVPVQTRSEPQSRTGSGCPQASASSHPAPTTNVQPQSQLEVLSLQALPSSSSLDAAEQDLPKTITRIGSKGTQIKIAANYLRLKLAEGSPGVVEYHVSYTGEMELESVGLRRKALKQFQNELGSVTSFDGMILYLPYILEDDVTVLHGYHPVNADLGLTAHITFVKVKTMRDSITFFNILLRRIMFELSYVELRREFYDFNMTQILAEHKMEIWPGLNITAEDPEGGLMINVDSCSRVIRTETLYDYYLMIRGDPKMKEKFNDFVINKFIMTKYKSYTTYRIDDVAWGMNPASTFEHKSGTISFADYLKLQYNINVQDMEQPMLLSKLKPRRNERMLMREETEQRIAALVPEFCFLTGLTEDQRSNFKVMTDLATSTRLTPGQRVEGLKKFVERVSTSERAKELLTQWNLTIEPDIVKLDGRRMEGPTLAFNKNTVITKAGPDFSREAGLAVYEPIQVKRYAVICTNRDSDKARRFVDTYKQVALPLGIKMLQVGEIVPISGFQPHNFVTALKHCRESGVQFVVIIMPQQRDDVYGAIKKFCVSEFAIPSQCILSKTLGNEKRLRSIVVKITLQINCKLGGSLWALRMPLKEQIMFVGIDAAHDPLKKDPSTICLVASLNNECTKYYSRAATCKVHQEMADNLRIMMEDALKKFREVRAGLLPDRIVIFRDGGSVGALDQIGKTEMNQLIEAVKMYAPKAKFTFVIVAKRIPQRFFLTNEKGAAFQNPQPGSVIDNTITHRRLFDFYLVSQQVRHGTVNPTHFIVLNPDDDISPDLIQKLAYVTTFMYYNWSGTVRVPAMVQYAHKLADLLSHHVKRTPNASFCDTLYYL
ncbi:unnamed protein product [Orchesella dallaii]|uniref:Piwi-like protein 1 n=1 Tax=Orchesella dallaii TaxID=48710 RepID=A0ABP1PTG5_9HEXA